MKRDERKTRKTGGRREEGGGRREEIRTFFFADAPITKEAWSAGASV